MEMKLHTNELAVITTCNGCNRSVTQKTWPSSQPVQWECHTTRDRTYFQSPESDVAHECCLRTRVSNGFDTACMYKRVQNGWWDANPIT